MQEIEVIQSMVQDRKVDEYLEKHMKLVETGNKEKWEHHSKEIEA